MTTLLLSLAALFCTVCFLLIQMVNLLNISPSQKYRISALLCLWMFGGSMLLYLWIGAPRIVDLL